MLYLFSCEAWQNTGFWWEINRKDSPYFCFLACLRGNFWEINRQYDYNKDDDTVSILGVFKTVNRCNKRGQFTPLLLHSISKLVLSGVISLEATHGCYIVKYVFYPLSPVNIHSLTHSTTRVTTYTCYTFCCHNTGNDLQDFKLSVF